MRGDGPRPQKIFVYGYPVEGNSNLLTNALSRYGEVHDVRFRHWLHMSEVADEVRVDGVMVRNQAIPRNLEVDGYHCKASYYGQAKECDICEKTGHIDKDCPFRLVTFTVIAAMNLLQQLPLVHVSCKLSLKTIRMARLWSLILQ